MAELTEERIREIVREEIAKYEQNIPVVAHSIHIPPATNNTKGTGKKLKRV